MILDIIGIGVKLVDKLIPDPKARDEAKLRLLEMQQAGDFKLLDADLQIAVKQADVNAVEAADPSLFKSGWRPGAGWVCVVGLAYTFIGQPLLA